MVDKIFNKKDNTKIYLLAPIVRGRKGEYRKEFIDLRKKGFQRLRINNEFYDIEDLPTLDRYKKHNIEVVVDRLVIKKSSEQEDKDLLQRLADSIEIALQLSEGLLYTLETERLTRKKFTLQTFLVQKVDSPLMKLSLEFSLLIILLVHVINVMG